jgi:hypothetical protein
MATNRLHEGSLPQTDLAGQGDLFEQDPGHPGDIVDIRKISFVQQGTDGIDAFGIESRERRLVQHGLHIPGRQADIAGNLLEVHLAAGPLVFQFLVPDLLGIDMGIQVGEQSFQLGLFLLELNDSSFQPNPVGQDDFFFFHGPRLFKDACILGLAIGFPHVLGLGRG